MLAVATLARVDMVDMVCSAVCCAMAAGDSSVLVCVCMRQLATLELVVALCVTLS